MPNLAMELRHLAQADRHISEGEQCVLAIERAIARASALDMNVDHSRVSLELVVETLAHFKAHRLLVLQAIDAALAQAHQEARQRGAPALPAPTPPRAGLDPLTGPRTGSRGIRPRTGSRNTGLRAPPAISQRGSQRRGPKRRKG